MAALRDADFLASVHGSPPRQRIMVNAGANKGYVASAMLGLWRTASGASPKDLFQYLLTRPITRERNRCGICDDCKQVLSPAPVGVPNDTAALGSAVVYAVEPQPSNYDLLKGYAAILDARGAPGVLLPFHMGLFSSDGNGTFEERGPGDEGSSLGNPNRGGGALVSVPLMTYDSFVKAHVDPSGSRIIDILYMDTEGYEPAVVAGGAATLPYTRLVVFEYSYGGLWDTTSLHTIVGTLDAVHGFDCFMEWRDGLVRLTGGCWNASLAYPYPWANVVCVNRRDAAWATAVGRFANLVTFDA